MSRVRLHARRSCRGDRCTVRAPLVLAPEERAAESAARLRDAADRQDADVEDTIGDFGVRATTSPSCRSCSLAKPSASIVTRGTVFSPGSHPDLTIVPSCRTARARIVVGVARESNSFGSRRNEASDPTALELSPQRAFVLHLDARAEPPRRMRGRIEHVTSGRIARITSLRGLVAFLAEVLGDGSGASSDRRSEE
jgi:hypothetical protein